MADDLGREAVAVVAGTGGRRHPTRLSVLARSRKPVGSNLTVPVWEFLRQHYLALRRFLDHIALLDACQHAWRRFIGQPGRIRSLCSYPWAAVP